MSHGSVPEVLPSVSPVSSPPMSLLSKLDWFVNNYSSEYKLSQG